MPITSKIRHNLTVVRSLATQRVIKSFADEKGLVYFGDVDQHRDEHRLVYGVTLSRDHRDRHYCVGSLDGYDAILLQRTDSLLYPKHPPKHYTWNIMQFDLRVPESTFQHIFIDAHHHDETFYNTLAVKFNKLRSIDPSRFVGHESAFVNGYCIMADTTPQPQLPYVLRPDITATLATHFKHLDFEIKDDTLIVYASNVVTTRHALEHMAKAGIWFTQALEAVASDPHFPR